MKLLIVSDIHGSLSAFNKAMDAFSREGAEQLVICGDYLNHGPRNDIPEGYDTKALAKALNGVKNVITGVRGNCDGEVDQMVLEFPVQGPYAQIMVPGKKIFRIFVHHGHLFTPEAAAALNPEGTLIVSGHTHVPVLEAKDGYYFLNPGSTTIPKGGSLPGYATVETAEDGLLVRLCTLDGGVLKELQLY